MQISEELEQRLARVGWKGCPAPAALPAGAGIARVIAQHRAGYQLHDGCEAFNAQPTARFLKPGIDPHERPAVGDFVVVDNAKTPLIEQILPRRSVLSRAASGERHLRQIIATNIDTVFVVTGLDGDFNAARIERYLLLIAGSGAEPVIVLTKADIAAEVEAAVAALRERVAAQIAIVPVNAKSADSVAPLRTYLQSGDSVVLVGSSGAGKSTLTNTLLGQTLQATAAVRRHDSRGRHTTTHRALIQLPGGACLIDTPGMRELKLTGSEDLDQGQFADIEELAHVCRFGDCSHHSEPGCAVRTALEDGRLDPARWQNYLKLRLELAAAAESLEIQLRRKGEPRTLNKALGKRPGEKYGAR